MPFNVLVSCGCFTISPFLTVLPSPLKKGDDLSIPLLYFFILISNSELTSKPSSAKGIT